MRNTTIYCVIVLTHILSGCTQSFETTAAISAVENQVNVTGGFIEGTTETNGVRVFKGIPFAAPPVGEIGRASCRERV